MDYDFNDYLKNTKNQEVKIKNKKPAKGDFTKG